MVQIISLLIFLYKNKTSIEPTTATSIRSILTDFKYLFVSGFGPSFLKAPAPKEITKKNRNTKNSTTNKIPNLPNILICILANFSHLEDILS